MCRFLALTCSPEFPPTFPQTHPEPFPSQGSCSTMYLAGLEFPRAETGFQVLGSCVLRFGCGNLGWFELGFGLAPIGVWSVDGAFAVDFWGETQLGQCSSSAPQSSAPQSRICLTGRFFSSPNQTYQASDRL